MNNFGRCSDCGENIELRTGIGRTREYFQNIWLPIPDDFAMPICIKCGAEYSVPEISEELDRILADKLVNSDR